LSRLRRRRCRKRVGTWQALGGTYSTAFRNDVSVVRLGINFRPQSKIAAQVD
jgi:hypothetical protein